MCTACCRRNINAPVCTRHTPSWAPCRINGVRQCWRNSLRCIMSSLRSLVAIKDAKKAAESQSTGHHGMCCAQGKATGTFSHLISVSEGNTSGMHIALSSIMARCPCTRLHPHIGAAMQEVLNVHASSKTAWMLMDELLCMTELTYSYAFSYELPSKSVLSPNLPQDIFAST